MRFNEKDFNSLLESTEKALLQNGVNIKVLKETYLNEGLSEARFIWDLFWLSKWHVDNRDNDYIDNHIQTAMKKVITTLSK